MKFHGILGEFKDAFETMTNQPQALGPINRVPAVIQVASLCRYRHTEDFAPSTLFLT